MAGVAGERRLVSRLGITLASFCLLDLVGTAIGIRLGYLEEWNPMLNYFYHIGGLPGFILSKMFFVIVPIAILETILRSESVDKQRIETYYKIAILGYVFILGGGIAFQLIAA